MKFVKEEQHLLKLWLPSKPTEKKSINNEILAENKRHGFFALTTVTEIFSFSQNLTQHILCTTQLERLPKIIADMCCREDSEEYETLKKLNNDYWSNDKSSEHILKRINSIKSKKMDVAEKKIYEILENENFTNFIESIFAGDKNHKIDDVSLFGLDQDLFKLLVDLTPFIERRIFLTKIASPSPLYLICRQMKIFRLWFILWIYKKREFFVDRDRKISLGGIDGWYLKTYKVLEKSEKNMNLIGISGPYLEADNTLSLENYHQKKGLNIENSILRLSEKKWLISATGQDNRQIPTARLFRSALLQKLPYSKKENDIRVAGLEEAWRLLNLVTIYSEIPYEEKPPESRPIYKFNHLESLATKIVWIMRYAQTKIYITLSKGRLNLATWIPTTRSTGLQIGYDGFLSKIIKIELKDYKIIENGKSIISKKKINYWDFVDEIQSQSPQISTISVILNRVISRRMNYKRSILELVNHILGHYAGEGFFDKNKGDSATLEAAFRHLINNLCLLICNLTGASTAQIFLLEYSKHPSRLKSAGDYSREAKLIIPEKIENYLNRNFDKKDEKGNPISFVIRAIYTRETQLEQVLKNGVNCDLTDDYPFLPSSGIAVPLLVHGRVFGLLQIKGTEKFQFYSSVMSILEQATNVIGPFLYQQKLMSILGQAQRDLSTVRPFIYHGSSNVLKSYTKKLCDIFLCDIAHIWLLRPIKNSFCLRGFNEPAEFSTEEEKYVYIKGEGVEPTSNELLAEYLPMLHKNTFGRLSIPEKYRTEFVQGIYVRSFGEPRKFTFWDKTRRILYWGTNNVLHTNHYSRKRLMSNYGMNQSMCFPLVDNTTSTESDAKEVVGFVALWSNSNALFEKGWQSVVELVANDLSYSVVHTNTAFNTRLSQEGFSTHQILAFSNAIGRKVIKSIKPRLDFIRHETNEKEPSIKKIRNALALANDEVSSMISGTILALQAQTSQLKHVPLIAQLGIPLHEYTQSISISEALDTISLEYRSQANKDKGIFWNEKINSNFHVSIHRRALDHIIRNLMDNAYKYATPSSEIYVSTTKGHRLIIRNDARWIEDDQNVDTKNLKEPGVRGNHVDDLSISGEGYGLAIVEYLCKYYLGRSCQYTIGEPQRRGLNYIRTHTITVDFSKMAGYNLIAK